MRDCKCVHRSGPGYWLCKGKEGKRGGCDFDCGSFAGLSAAPLCTVVLPENTYYLIFLTFFRGDVDLGPLFLLTGWFPHLGGLPAIQ
jgi:hypothetical protein